MSLSISPDRTPPAGRLSPAAPELGGLSLADYATRVLRDRLIVLDIPPGAPMNDELIGKELGIGRTPVREAIKRLESEYLVSVYPRRGTFAAMVDITDLAEIAEIRAQLEPLAAARAARNATPERRAELRSVADELESIDLPDTPPRSLMQHDLDVHRSIYAASGNKHLQEVLLTYDNLATRIWCMVIDRLPRVDSHIVEHVTLLRAIADGDEERARQVAYDHVMSFEQLVRSVI